MKCFVIALTAMVMPATASSAQSWDPIGIPKFDSKVLQRAIQCEVGHFARLVRRQKLDSPHMKASYAISAKYQGSDGWKVTFPIFGPQSDDDHGYEGGATFDKPFNVDVANEGACPKKIPGLELLDLRACLANYAPIYSESAVTCESHVHVKRSVGFDGKVTFFVTVGLGASFGADFTQSAKVVAPPAARRGADQ